MSLRFLVAFTGWALAAMLIVGCGTNPTNTPNANNPPKDGDDTKGPAAPSAPTGAGVTVLAPKEAIAVAIIQADALQKNSDLKPLLDVGQRAQTKVNAPFDFFTITEVHLSLSPKVAGDPPYGPPVMPFVVAKFRGAAELAAAMKSNPVAARFVDAEHNGKKYRRHPQGNGEAHYQRDDRTIVMGPERLIKSFIDSATPPAKLVEAINRPTMKGQIRLAYQPGEEKALVDQVKRNLPPGVPPQVVKLLDVPKHVTFAAMSVHVSGDEFLRVELDTAGGDSPAEVKDRLDAGLEFAKVSLDLLIALQLENSPAPDEIKKLAKPFVAETLGKLKVSAEGARVVVSLPVSAELAKMLRDKTPMLVQSLEAAAAAAQAAADRVRRMNNLRQVGLGAITHQFQSRTFPDDIRDADGKPLLSWRVQVLPYVEETLLYRQIDLKQAWDSPRNKDFSSRSLGIFNTVADPAAPFPKNNIVRFVGPGALFDGVKAPSPAEVKDGTSKTILFVEAGPSKAVPWAQPADVPFDPKDPIKALGDIPPEGFRAIFCDGHVQVIPRTIKPEVLKALITPAGGELINYEDFEGP